MASHRCDYEPTFVFFKPLKTEMVRIAIKPEKLKEAKERSLPRRELKLDIYSLKTIDEQLARRETIRSTREIKWEPSINQRRKVG